MSNSPESKPASGLTPNERYKESAVSKLESANSSTLPERSLWKGGYSPKAMYGSWLASALITIISIAVVIILGRASDATVWYIVGTGILVLWAIVIAIYIYRRLGMHYELTTQRFIHQSGVLIRRTERIEVIDIEDISYTQGIVQRMLGVGTIRISSRDQSHPELDLCGIDKVPEVASLIDDVRREERNKRSLHTR
jgi:membrane protein YdbS with pleckstrin-like domain